MSQATQTQGTADDRLAQMLRHFYKARIVGTPLVAITTTDPAATVETIKANLAEVNDGGAILHWDIARGYMGVNRDGETVATNLGDEAGVGNPAEALVLAATLPEDAIVFLQNFHLFLESPLVIQSLWNLRDAFKANGRMAVMLAPSLHLPEELKNDVLMMEEPLPTATELEEIVTRQYEQAREENPTMPPLTAEVVAKAVDATVGLNAYSAEQSVALSLTRSGMDLAELWERKRGIIEQTPGLKIYRGTEGFEDIAGCSNVKDFLARLISASKSRTRCVLWLDEIEKMFEGLGGDGSAGDSNGLTSDKLGVLLKWMEDTKAKAVLLIGFPGTGKSLVAKALGTEAGCPTVEVDLGAMSHHLVGSSEARVRAFTKVASAMAPEGVVVVATCNNVGKLPPELLSRFRRGQFFFDMPTVEARQKAWGIHIAAHGLEANPANHGVNDEGWTGREIEACCGIAADLGMELAEAAMFVVPVSRTMGAKANTLREMASGRFVNADAPGVYETAPTPSSNGAQPKAGTRKMGNLGGNPMLS